MKPVPRSAGPTVIDPGCNASGASSGERRAFRHRADVVRRVVFPGTGLVLFLVGIIGTVERRRCYGSERAQLPASPETYTWSQKKILMALLQPSFSAEIAHRGSPELA